MTHFALTTKGVCRLSSVYTTIQYFSLTLRKRRYHNAPVPLPTAAPTSTCLSVWQFRYNLLVQAQNRRYMNNRLEANRRYRWHRQQREREGGPNTNTCGGKKLRLHPYYSRQRNTTHITMKIILMFLRASGEWPLRMVSDSEVI